MAASQQADDVPARLEAVRQSLHTVAGTVLFIGSTVMSPDGPQVEVVEDKALERAIREVLSDVMFESPDQSVLRQQHSDPLGQDREDHRRQSISANGLSSDS